MSAGVRMDELLGETDEAQIASSKMGPDSEKQIQRLLDSINLLKNSKGGGEQSPILADILAAIHALKPTTQPSAAVAAAQAENSFLRWPVQLLRGNNQSMMYYEIRNNGAYGFPVSNGAADPFAAPVQAAPGDAAAPVAPATPVEGHTEAPHRAANAGS
jgi:hypothetical protein